MNWIKLHSMYNNQEVFVDITQVRTMYRSQSPTHHYNAVGNVVVGAPSPPGYVTVLIYAKDDTWEVQETPEEILRLAKGIKPQASAFSLEELEAAQDDVEKSNSQAQINGAPEHSTHMTWTQMWSKPFEPQQE